jgi:phosphotransferase system, enzyme I, PtsP
VPHLYPTIHARGAASRLDGVLDLVAFAARPCPLSTALDELPRRIAELFPCEVCSIYLLEGRELVMRGNVGFPDGALGEVRLAVGEGLTGLAVEYMRPLSLDVASAHAGNRSFPALDEDRFPIFMAMPVAGPHGPLGALVLRRRQPPAFTPADLELAAALTAPIAAVAERARLDEVMHRSARAVCPRDGAGTRRITLPGRPLVSGRAVGPVSALRRPATLGMRAAQRPAIASRRALDQVIALSRRRLEELGRRAAELGLDADFLRQFLVILDDARLQERVLDLVDKGRDMAHALSLAGAEATRAMVQLGDAFALERARAIDDLCEALAMLVADQAPEIPRHAVLIGDQVTVFDLLISTRAQPAAIVLADKATPLAQTLLTLVGVPAVVDVSRLFSWIADGDIALVDGDHGLVRVNPSRAELALIRAQRKHRGAAGSARAARPRGACARAEVE